jgi:hypothetical protein
MRAPPTVAPAWLAPDIRAKSYTQETSAANNVFARKVLAV